MTTPAYFTQYENLQMTRGDDGVVLVRFHTDGSSARLAMTSPPRSSRSPSTVTTKRSCSPAPATSS